MNIIRNHELIKKLDICTTACNFCFRLKPAQKPAGNVWKLAGKPPAH